MDIASLKPGSWHIAVIPVSGAEISGCCVRCINPLGDGAHHNAPPIALVRSSMRRTLHTPKNDAGRSDLSGAATYDRSASAKVTVLLGRLGSKPFGASRRFAAERTFGRDCHASCATSNGCSGAKTLLGVPSRLCSKRPPSPSSCSPSPCAQHSISPLCSLLGPSFLFSHAARMGHPTALPDYRPEDDISLEGLQHEHDAVIQEKKGSTSIDGADMTRMGKSQELRRNCKQIGGFQGLLIS